MVKYEDECVDCVGVGLRCLGNSCPNRNVPRWYCDECGSEEDLYEFDDKELCISCIISQLPKVNA